MAASKKKPVKKLSATAHSVKVATAKKKAAEWAAKDAQAEKALAKAPAKKSVAVAARPPRKSGSRVASTAVATSKTKPQRKPKLAVLPEWRITLIFGNATGVFGLATDQRVYRWNTRSALWVLHKEGLSATQQ